MGVFSGVGKPKSVAMSPSSGPGVFGSLGGVKPGKKPDLSTVEGLSYFAQQQEGYIPREVANIIKPEASFWGRVASGVKKSLMGVIRVINVGANISAGILDPNKTVIEAVKEDIMPSDILWKDIKPETKVGKVGKFALDLATDVLLDPTTYVTFGMGASMFGARAARKLGGKALKEAGETFLQKGIRQGLKGGLSEDFVKKAMISMIDNNPTLAKKFIDQGGIKFFGKTLLSGERITVTIKSLPGMKPIEKATQPIRNTLGALFNKNVDPAVGKLPKELVELSNKFSGLSKVKSTQAVNKVMDIARANKLTYAEAEIVSNAIDTGVRNLADPRLDNVMIEMKRILGIARKAERERGILKKTLDNYVPHQLVDEPTKIPLKPPGLKSATIGSSRHRTIEGTIENINADFGKQFFDPNIVKTTAVRAVSSARATTSYDFSREVIKGFGALAKEAPSNFIEVAPKLYKGYKFHPAVARYIEQFQSGIISDVATNKMFRAFDKLQGLWKASVTSIFPQFHGRNAISNVFLNYLDIGLNAIHPARHYISGLLLEKNRQATKLTRLAMGTGDVAKTASDDLVKLLGQNILTDRYGYKWTFGELQRLIKNNRVAFGAEFTGFMDIGEDIAEKLTKTGLKGKKLTAIGKKALPVSQEFLPFKIGRRVGQWIEEEARLVNFVSNLRKTGDPLLAAKRTKQFLFDYQNLSKFEKNVMKRVFPFYTFTRKNLELQARSLVNVPGRVASETKVLTTLSDVISGGQKLTKEEESALPDWIKQGISALAEKKGKTLTILGSLQTPFEQPFQALQANQLLGSLSPILRVPLEQASGYNFFYGKPLSEVTNAAAFKDAPEAIKKFIAFQEVSFKDKDGKQQTWYTSLNPERMHLLLNLPPTSRILSTLKQVQTQDVSQGYKILQQTVGIRPYSFDLEKEERKRETEMRKEIEDLLDQAGVVYKFDIIGIPEEKE